VTDASWEMLTFAEEINVSDVMPEDCSPAEFYRSMLDDINAMARGYGWKGVTICNAGWDKRTRVFSICCRKGGAPATLHLFKKVVAAQKAYFAIQGGKDDGEGKAG